MPVLTATAAVLAPPAGPYVRDEQRLAFYRDLVEPFGSEVDETVLGQAPQRSHHDLIDRLVDGISSHRPEMVVLAHALPDIHPFSVPGTYLVRMLGGSGVPVGISQQGLAAPFTALRVLSAYQHTETALAVLEQTTLPTRFPLVHDNNLVDSGVLLLFGGEGGPTLGEVRAADDEAGLQAELSELVTDPAATLLVLGPWCTTAVLPDGVPVHRAGPGSYCTSVWLALAEHWQTWQRTYAAVILCDTEPRTGTTHLAVLRGQPA